MSPAALRSSCLALALATAGCTSTAVVAPEARYALAQTTTGDFLRLPTAGGGSVVFGPNATLHIDGGEGTTDVTAGDVYSNEAGLFARNGDPISSWEDLRSVSVEQLDGAATVAVSATAVIALVALAALLKSSGGTSPRSSSSSAHAASSTPRAPAVRSAPNPSPLAPDPAAVTDVLFRTAEALSSSSGQVTVATSAIEPEPRTTTPLFSRGSRRRSHVRVLARLEGGVCWPKAGPNGDCVTSGARLGVRLVDLVELTGGVRVESDLTTTRPLAVFGAMLHGEAPGAHWFALGLGASIAFDDVRARVIPELSVRFRPVRGLWLALVPLAPVYATEDGSWTMTSGVELTGEL